MAYTMGRQVCVVEGGLNLRVIGHTVLNWINDGHMFCTVQLNKLDCCFYS